MIDLDRDYHREYVVVGETGWYGPSTTYHLVARHDHLTVAREEAKAYCPDYDGTIQCVRLCHNQASATIGRAYQAAVIDADDWGSWPDELEAEACALARESGIDPEDGDAIMGSEIDWPHEAAQRLGGCAVCDTQTGDLLLCLPPMEV